MSFGETIPCPANSTGIRHTLIRKNGVTIGHYSEYITGPTQTHLNPARQKEWERLRRQSEQKKQWSDLLKEINESEKMSERLKKQLNQKKAVEKIVKPVKKNNDFSKETIDKWQHPLSPWIKIWKEDPELRKLFSSYLHMRAVAAKKGYNREWLFQLKQEEKAKRV